MRNREDGFFLFLTANATRWNIRRKGSGKLFRNCVGGRKSPGDGHATPPRRPNLLLPLHCQPSTCSFLVAGLQSSEPFCRCCCWFFKPFSPAFDCFLWKVSAPLIIGSLTEFRQKKGSASELTSKPMNLKPLHIIVQGFRQVQ